MKKLPNYCIHWTRVVCTNELVCSNMRPPPPLPHTHLFLIAFRANAPSLQPRQQQTYISIHYLHLSPCYFLICQLSV